jgi:hyperosmotically inducible protein
MTKELIAAALFAGFVGLSPQARPPQTTPPQTTPPVAPDNTKVNKDGGLTADQQSQSKADLDLVAKIRQAILANKTLSTNAHNCKVITRDGAVTLRGPVNSAKEKSAVGDIATKIAGAGKVTNVLTVKTTK